MKHTLVTRLSILSLGGLIGTIMSLFIPGFLGLGGYWSILFSGCNRVYTVKCSEALGSPVPPMAEFVKRAVLGGVSGGMAGIMTVIIVWGAVVTTVALMGLESEAKFTANAPRVGFSGEIYIPMVPRLFIGMLQGALWMGLLDWLLELRDTDGG